MAAKRKTGASKAKKSTKTKKGASGKKKSVKKSGAKKTTGKKKSTKKTGAKKTTGKKKSTKKTGAKKTTGKKTSAKKTAKKAGAKKTSGKKTGAKKTSGKKTSAKKTAGKKTGAKKAGAKKSSGGGKVKKSIYLEFVGGSSAKFWEGSVKGSEFHVRYGRIGAAGATQIKSFDSPADAQAAYVKVMEQKLKKGYGVAKKPAAAKVSTKKAVKKAAKKKSPAKKKKPAKPAATSKSSAYMEFVGGSSSKFWEGSVKGTDLHVRYGRIGADGAKQLKSFGSKDEARAAFDKLVHQKLKKGYSLIR